MPMERRRSLRLAVEAPAVLLSTARVRVRAGVLDLSRTGCRVRTRLRCCRGDGFVLRIGAFEPKAVTVAWISDGEVGLAFARPLAWSVVRAIAAGAAQAERPVREVSPSATGNRPRVHW